MQDWRWILAGAAVAASVVSCYCAWDLRGGVRELALGGLLALGAYVLWVLATEDRNEQQ